MLKNSDLQKTHQILNFTKLVLSQNYFTILNKIYQPPKKDVAMGSLISKKLLKYSYKTSEINI